MTIKEKLFYEKLFVFYSNYFYSKFYSSAALRSAAKHIALQSSVLRSRMTTVCDFWKDGIVNNRVFCPFESKNYKKI